MSVIPTQYDYTIFMRSSFRLKINFTKIKSNNYRCIILFSGVILFAMLNGRLPFNDSQLMEMEEDMKMQRLRFERNVSFGKYLISDSPMQFI